MESHTSNKKPAPCAISIGKFDGVHLGHRRIISELTAFKKKGLRAMVLGFEKSPAAFFTGEPDAVISTHRQRRDLLKELGVDEYVIYPVNETSMGMEPEVFIREVLRDRYNARAVVAGEDCSFGKGGRGDIKLLEKMGKELGFETVSVKKLFSEKYGCEISSTRIREFITAHDMEAAAALLGRPYAFEGTVIKGRQIGRTLDMPTANIYPEDGRLLPPFGVYVSQILIAGKTLLAVTNIGMNPTVTDRKRGSKAGTAFADGNRADQGQHVSVESYIYDFDADIYEEDIRVSLLSFMRPERKMASLDELREQLWKDRQAGLEWFGKRP